MKFISTPSHGYLKVTVSQFLTDSLLTYILTTPNNEFGYGYTDGKHVWLEEDCEAPKWMELNSIDAKTIPFSYSEAFDKKRDNLPSISYITNKIRQVKVGA